jgi:hypothetical protein
MASCARLESSLSSARPEGYRADRFVSGLGWNALALRAALGRDNGRAGWLHRDGQVHQGLKAKGNDLVHANDDRSPLMASAKKPNKEIPKTRNK